MATTYELGKLKVKFDIYFDIINNIQRVDRGNFGYIDGYSSENNMTIAIVYNPNIKNFYKVHLHDLTVIDENMYNELKETKFIF